VVAGKRKSQRELGDLDLTELKPCVNRPPDGLCRTSSVTAWLMVRTVTSANPAYKPRASVAAGPFKRMRIISRQRLKSNYKLIENSDKLDETDYPKIQFSTAGHSIPSKDGALGVPRLRYTQRHANFPLSSPPATEKHQQIRS
jgi:hypothetical protein